MQQHEELLAAESHHVVASAHKQAQHPRDVAQHTVTSGVPSGVVDKLEMIEVEKQDTDFRAATQAASRLLGRHLLQPARIVQSGEGVGTNSLLQLSVEPRVVPGRSGDVRKQRAVLEIAITEAVEAVPPDVEHTDAAVTRDQRDHQQGSGA
jgi:hypothetical protein